MFSGVHYCQRCSGMGVVPDKIGIVGQGSKPCPRCSSEDGKNFAALRNRVSNWRRKKTFVAAPHSREDTIGTTDWMINTTRAPLVVIAAEIGVFVGVALVLLYG